MEAAEFRSPEYKLAEMFRCSSLYTKLSMLRKEIWIDANRCMKWSPVVYQAPRF